ncbi:MAG: DUF5626 family protein [Alkalibacterium sp.]|nr:DUF5626 family protein [Atopostipes suicloacalis]MDN6730041.1 DUF5626 family protein [Alkalibacterium sp.]
MKKLFDLVFLTIGCTLLLFAFPDIANAVNNNQHDSFRNEDNEAVDFDLEALATSGSLEKKTIDNSNVIHTFVVEEDASKGFSTFILRNKTYIVRHSESGVYEASFKMDINSKKIRRVHSDKIKSFRGSISKRRLTRLSNTRARLSFNQRYLLFSANKKITASIYGKTLSVTVSQ